VAAQHKPVTPLCATSAHNPSVHKSWPKAVARRIQSLSSGNSSALTQLRDRYLRKCIHPYTLGRLNSYVENPSSCTGRVQHGHEPQNGSQIIPFVCRYHPLFKWAVSRTLTLVPPPSELRVKFRASWRNSLPSMRGIVAKARQKSCKRVLEREGRCFFVWQQFKTQRFA